MWNEPFNSWAVQKHSKARASHWKLEVFCFCGISWLCVLQGWVQHSPQLRLFHLGERLWLIRDGKSLTSIMLCSFSCLVQRSIRKQAKQITSIRTGGLLAVRNGSEIALTLTPALVTVQCLMICGCGCVCVCNRERFPHHSIFWPDENRALERITYWQ